MELVNQDRVIAISDRIETPTGSSEEASFTKDPGALQRRVNRFRRAGMLELPPELTIAQATSADDLCQAYEMVHDVFVHQGYISAQPGSMRIRPFEALPEMATFVAKAGDRVVAVMSVVPDTEEFGLPSDKAFGHELAMLRREGRWVAETTNLAVAPEYRSSGVFFELARTCMAHGINQGIDDLFISISPGHSTFFQAVLCFEPWGDRRDYGCGQVDYVEGMRLNLRQAEQRAQNLDRLLGAQAFLHNWFFTHNPQFEATQWWAKGARQAFLKPSLLRQLFVERTAYLSRCSDDVLTALRNRWGLEAFSSLVAENELGSVQAAA